MRLSRIPAFSFRPACVDGLKRTFQSLALWHLPHIHPEILPDMTVHIGDGTGIHEPHVLSWSRFGATSLQAGLGNGIDGGMVVARQGV